MNHGKHNHGVKRLEEHFAAKRRAEAAAQREKTKRWVSNVATDTLSNMLGTLLAAGFVVLFGSLIGAIHGLTRADFLLTLAATVSLFAAVGFLAYSKRVESGWRRELEQAEEELQRFTESAVAQAREVQLWHEEQLRKRESGGD
jgi:hypothetical protein